MVALIILYSFFVFLYLFLRVYFFPLGIINYFLILTGIFAEYILINRK